jgi:hypothetical protein
MGKTVRLSPGEVNTYAAKVKKQISKKDFDDEHFVAIVAISGCRVVCTDDERAFPYLLNPNPYPKQREPSEDLSAHGGEGALQGLQHRCRLQR